MNNLKKNEKYLASKSEFSFFPINLHPDPRSKSLYMVKPYTELNEFGEVIIEQGKVVNFDGFMSSLYERELNSIVPNADLFLELEIQGSCKISLYHRSQNGTVTEYETKKSSPISGIENQKIRINFNIVGNEAHLGRWYFTVESTDFSIPQSKEFISSNKKFQNQCVVLKNAFWGIRNVNPNNIHPCFVICTFKREKQLNKNIEKLIEILGNNDKEYDIIIVDNASSVTRQSHWPSNIKLIHQRNVGGAGGFGRGIFDALNTPPITHIIMLDDDADIESTAIIRMLNLFSLSSNPEIFIGGVQLDVYDPAKLADGGAYWVPDRFERPFSRLSPSDLGELDSKDALMTNHNINFNGWWLFGGHVNGFRKFGMPLPCFVHLDDVEYGVRLTMKGGQILSVPGIAVWHEPYYAKPEGWFAYYNIRNELIRVACHTHLLYSLILNEHFSKNRERIEKRITNLMQRIERHLIKRFNAFIKIYHYGSAILLVKAIEDFLKGPSILTETDAADLHQEIMDIFKKFNINYKFSLNLPLGTSATKPQSAINRVVPWISKNSDKYPVLGNTYSIYQKITQNGNISFLHKESILKKLSAKNREIIIFDSRNDINWRQIPAGHDWGYYDPQKIGYHIYSSNPDLYKKAHTRFKLAIKCYVDNVSKMHSDWSKEYKNLISESFWRDLIKTFN